MSANVNPIYTRRGDVQWVPQVILTGNAAMDGTGGAHVVFIADPTEGGYIHRVRLRPLGTNIGCVARLFINNGDDPEVAANNVLYEEATLQNTFANSIASLGPVEMHLGFAMPPGYRLLLTLSLTVAAGYVAIAIGGRY